MSVVIDQAERLEALNVNGSYIVQAPAGSGKTELLVQRAISCLLTVSQPQHVLLLTFTKKAAAEMNERLNQAIFNHAERHLRHPETQALLARLDTHMQTNKWDVANGQLQLAKTFDGFTYTLSGLNYHLANFPVLLYRTVLENIFYGDDHALFQPLINPLLSLIDGDHEKLIQLLIDLMQKRDQWLPPLLNQAQHTKSTYQAFVQALINLIENNHNSAFQALFDFNQAHLESMQGEPGAWTLHDLQYLANCFLTQTGTWRKRLLPEHNDLLDKAQKDMLKSLLAEQDPKLAEWLTLLQPLPASLPPTHQTQLDMMQQALPKLCAAMHIAMETHELCDYTYVAYKAIEVLTQPEHAHNPASIQASQIQHLLIDECQDTSKLQCLLLEALVRHWPDQDGRSLFLVGDPMQSIYRFRQADVRIFLALKADGLAGIPLQYLSLKQNFRSSKTLIEHFNTIFVNIFPAHPIPMLGGINYAEAEAFHQFEGTIKWYPAYEVAQLVKDIESLPADETCAVLARSRRHLLPLQRAFGAKAHMPGLCFYYEYPWIQEIATLALSVYAPDLISQVALKRLHVFNLHWSFIQQQAKHSAEDALLSAIAHAQTMIDLEQPSTLVMDLAHAFVSDQFDHPIAQQFYALLDTLMAETGTLSRAHLQHVMLTQCPEIQPHSATKITLTTIHQSKGLQFDHVIIPHIHAGTTQDSDQLLHWFQYDEASPMMMGLLKQEASHNGIHQTLRQLEKKAQTYETQRLLYVAATRAKKTLTYIGEYEKTTRGFSGLLQQANFKPTDEAIDDIEPNTAHPPLSRNQTQTQSVPCRGLNSYQPKSLKGADFGRAVHHLIECMLSTRHVWAELHQQPELKALANGYATSLNAPQLKDFYHQLIQRPNANKLFNHTGQKWIEFSLFDAIRQTTIRIDYLFCLADQLILVDFKTNTHHLADYQAQLSLYESALSDYFKQPIAATYIYNPLTDELYNKSLEKVNFVIDL
jgi:ATP-dependent helicase/nuclease subunit A